MTRSLFSGVLATTALVGLAQLSAQVPDGWHAVAGANANPSFGFPGPGGIYLLHPRNQMSMIPVQGLPASLTGSGFTVTWQGGIGASAILFDSELDQWIAGNMAPLGNTIDLHLFSVIGTPSAGFTATIASTIPLGTSTQGGPTQPSLPTGEITQMAWLPGGNLLVGCAFVQGAVLTGSSAELVIVSRATGSVTPVTVSGVPSGWILNAVCVDRSGSIAYLGCFNPLSATGVSAIYQVPIPSGGTAQLCASIPGLNINQLVCDSTGALHAALTSVTGANLDTLMTINPQTWIPIPLVRGWSVFNALGQEPATGYLVAGGTFRLRSPIAGIHWLDQGNNLNSLSNTLTSGPRGIVNGIATVPNPRPYGSPSGAGTFRWSNQPNSNGLPLVGNALFSVTMNGALPPTSWWMASFDSANLPNWMGLGIDLLVSPATNHFVAFAALPPSGILPLPIPNNPNLADLRFHLQSLLLTMAGPTASDGLRITVL